MALFHLANHLEYKLKQHYPKEKTIDAIKAKVSQADYFGI